MNETTSQNQGIQSVCLINSLPKSGTHLLGKLISLFPGMVPANFHLGPRPSDPEPSDGTKLSTEGVGGSSAMIPVGVGRPRLMPRSEIYRALSALTKGTFATAHVLFSPDLALLLDELKIKLVTIIRDPRDVVVSLAKFVPNRPQDSLCNYYRSLSEDERIMTSIVGIKEVPPGCLRNIRERLESVLLWKSQPFNLMTSFERLIGPRGGGSRELQLEEISMIARHLGVNCSAAEIESLADGVFGNSETFLRGVIGSWRECFTEDHKQACRALVGRLLIDLGYEEKLDW